MNSRTMPTMNDRAASTRELTAKERSGIKTLAVKMCANYDGTDKICLPLDDTCYMFGKYWTGGYCKYFKSAVLPLEPALLVTLIGGMESRQCGICGGNFPKNGKRAYCSAGCTDEAKKRQQRGYMRERRYKC